jgi:hypothetical protein
MPCRPFDNAQGRTRGLEARAVILDCDPQLPIVAACVDPDEGLIFVAAAPCLTAFSTRVCTTIVGTNAPRASSARRTSTCKRAPKLPARPPDTRDELELVVEQRPLLSPPRSVAKYVGELFNRAVCLG